MIRTAAVRPEHRANLRQLKADFEQAFAAIENIRNHTSLEFLEAEALYRIWIKAIDKVAIALLDDIDALEAGAAEKAARFNVLREATFDGVHSFDLFTHVNEFEQARRIIGTPADFNLNSISKDLDESHLQDN